MEMLVMARTHFCALCQNISSRDDLQYRNNATSGKRGILSLSNPCWSVISLRAIEKVMIQGNPAGGLTQ